MNSDISVDDTDITILRYIAVSPDPAFVPQELAHELGINKETARNRMNDLVDMGLLSRKKPGARTVMYWITTEGKQFYSDHSSDA
jgi:DNA-binding MarR family transcriptional regulator